MSKKSRSRSDRRAKYAPQCQEFRITDAYTRYHVTLRSPIRFAQLIARGWVEQVNLTTGRLIGSLKLASSELAPNGEPMLRALPGETIWPQNSGCMTNTICETAWRLAGNASFTFEDVEAALAARQKEIEDETLVWGLPEWKAPRIAEDWGPLGRVDYI